MVRVSFLALRVRPVRSRRMTGRSFRNASVASAAGRVNRALTAATHVRSGLPRTATTSRTFVPGRATRAFATAVLTYAFATAAGSSTSRLRSTITGSGPANLARTAATAWAGVRPPTRTPATRTPAGSVATGRGLGVGATG